MADLETKVRRSTAELAQLVAAIPYDMATCQEQVTKLSGLIQLLFDERTSPLSLSGQLWSEALLEQAREDLAATEILLQCEGPTSVIVMLLQMYFEKLAKAVLARTDIQSFRDCRNSHVAASRLISSIKAPGRYAGLRHKWKGILPLVQALERAHPAVAKHGPHLEYPWEAGDKMALPRTHLQIVKEFEDPRNPSGPTLMLFAVSSATNSTNCSNNTLATFGDRIQ